MQLRAGLTLLYDATWWDKHGQTQAQMLSVFNWAEHTAQNLWSTVGRLKVTSWWCILQQDRLSAIIFKNYLVKVGKFLVDWYSASSCCSMFELI